jgi:hypothetical protein
VTVPDSFKRAASSKPNQLHQAFLILDDYHRFSWRHPIVFAESSRREKKLLEVPYFKLAPTDAPQSSTENNEDAKDGTHNQQGSTSQKRNGNEAK